MAELATELLILGLGNVLCGDDGAGVLAVHQLRRAYEPPPGVEVMDGGTLGLALLSVLGGARKAILVDAVQAAAPPGSLLRLEGEDVRDASLHRLSPHQVGVAELLNTARLMNALPESLVLVGIVPESIELSVEVSAPVASNLRGLVELVVAEARAQGYDLSPRGGHEETHAAARSHRDVARWLSAAR